MKKPEKDLGFLNRDQTDEVRFFISTLPHPWKLLYVRLMQISRLSLIVERMDADRYPYLSLLPRQSDIGHLQSYSCACRCCKSESLC